MTRFQASTFSCTPRVDDACYLHESGCPQVCTSIHRFSPRNSHVAPSCTPQDYTSVISAATGEGPGRRQPHRGQDSNRRLSMPHRTPLEPDPANAEYEPGVNVTAYTLPASYEDMEYLGLDPLTGDPVEADN